MNNKIYKVIFSVAQGLWIAVGELASQYTGSKTRKRGNDVSLRSAHLPLILTTCGISLCAVPVQAEVVANSSAPLHQRPTITTTASGVQQVNIQTPSAAGLSHNRYSRFDVDKKGVILNNSRNLVQTQLAGFVLGNPSLAAGTASRILNEVNSSDPSQLRGFIEVAGDRAQVIVANPAGITCDGCGFINANRATLTTGKPIINAGSLDGYIVNRGTVLIDGDGLDSSTSNYTDIIARAVKVNAGIHANDLRITAGSNQVDRNNEVITPVDNDEPSAGVSIDTALLGGMYANKIRLVSTEAGVGVRNHGTVAASAGELEITSNGWLQNSGALFGDDVVITTKQLENKNTDEQGAVIAARQNLDIAVETLENERDALLLSEGSIAIGAELDGETGVSGRSESISNHGGIIEALGEISIEADVISNTNADFSTTTEQVENRVVQEFALVGSPNRYLPSEVSLRPDRNDDVNFLVTPGGESDAYNQFDYRRRVTQTRVVESVPGQILAGNDITITGGSLLNDNSRILAGGALTADLDSLVNNETMGQRISRESGTLTTYTRRHEKGRDSTRVRQSAYRPAVSVQTISLGEAAFDGNAEMPAGENTAVSNRLFGLVTEPGATFLVETDPRFTNQRQFLSSDFVIEQLRLDPHLTQKRLGDGFYEQRLIREQVAQLTGRRFLEGYSNDEEQFRALLNAGVTAIEEFNFRPGIALTGEQIAQLTSDVVLLVEKEVRLPGGDVQKALVPQLYVRLQEGDLNGNGGLLAAETVNITTVKDITNAGRIAGRELVDIEAENIRNTGGKIAGLVTTLRGKTNILVEGGELEGEHSLSVEAGQDIKLTSSTGEQQGAQGSRTNISRLASLFVSSGEGTLVASAGRDIEINAALVTNTADEGRTVLSAGNSIISGVVEERFSQETVHDGNNYRKESAVNEVGSNIFVSGELELQAGQDLVGRALTANSEQGSVSVIAGNDVVLTAARDRLELDEAFKNKSKGFLSSTTRFRREELEEERVVESTISAGEVNIQAGAGILVEGSSIVSDSNVALNAGEDIDVLATSEKRRQKTTRIKKKSGVFSSGGFGVTIGKQQETNKNKGTTETVAGSTVGSVEGDIDIEAGQAYTQTGSTVISTKGSINVAAESIDVEAGKNSSVDVQETEFKQSGLSISISNPVLSAAQTIKQVDAASQRTKDSRLQSLATATKGLAVYDALTAIRARKAEVAREAIKRGDKDALDTNDPENPVADKRTLADKAGGINLNVSIGSSKSSSRSEQHSEQAASSIIHAGQDVVLRSTGEKAGTAITGSQVSAGNNIVIESRKDIGLRAAKNTSVLDRENDSSSASIGFSVGTNGFTVNASASKGEGQAEGVDVTYTPTEVRAGNGVALVSTDDTVIVGSTVSGEQLVAEVGGDLHIESLQATSTYESEQSSRGFSLSIPIGAGTISGNVNAGQTNVEAEFASVQQQAGLLAGDEGFQVTVQGNTNLVAGKIASTEEAEQQQKNRLVTATLTSRDLQNHEEVEGSQTGISLSSGPITKYKVARTLISNLSTNTELESDQVSTTQSSVGTTNIMITDEGEQQALTGKTATEVVASITADVTSDVDSSNALVKTNAQVIETELESSKQIKEAFAAQVEAITDDAYRTLFEREILFYKVTCPAEAKCTANPKRAIVTLTTKKDVIENGNEDTVIAVNGIFNGLERAGELAYQNAVDLEKVKKNAEDVKPTTIYLAHYVPADGILGEYLAVGYEKFLSGLDYDTASALGYSNATNAYAEILHGRQDKQTQSLGHSRGTIVQQNAFEILGKTTDVNGNRYNGEKLSVRSFGPAVNVSTLAKKAANVDVDEERIHASYFDVDPVSGFTTSNPTASTIGELLKSLYDVYKHDNSPHSCGGTGAPGCKQVEHPVPGGEQGTPEGNATLRTFIGGKETTGKKQ